MQHYFISEPITEEKIITITGEDFHHMVHVMRMKLGDQVIIISEISKEACQAEVIKVEPESVSLLFLKWQTRPVELPIKITIASGLPKGDKPDLIVQKCTELGAHQFILFSADRSIVKWGEKKKEKKLTRLKKIAKEAAEQSHRGIIPSIYFQEFSVFVKTFHHYDAVVCAYEESAKNNEKNVLLKVFQSLKRDQSLLVIFGPEGGISKREIDLLATNNAVFAGLGPRILRAETAPFYVLSAASFYFELKMQGKLMKENDKI